jgi:hypothetical protein
MKIRSPNRPWKTICSDFGLTTQHEFRGSYLYLLAPWPELSLPHVQIKGIVEAYNFGSQTIAIRGRLSLRICTERSCCPGLWEYLSSWVDLVSKHQVTGVLRVDASVLGLFGILFTSCLDLWRASWSSLEVLDELIPKMSSLTLISYENNKQQNQHARVKDRFRRPERGEWMGADKNSSLWLNSAYTPNSQLRIPTRVCQGHVVTTDLPTLGTNLKSIQHGNTTQKAKDLGNLESTRRTVRSVRADCPWGGRGLSARRARTVRKSYPNLQYCTEKNRPSVMDPRTVRLVTDRPTH